MLSFSPLRALERPSPRTRPARRDCRKRSQESTSTWTALAVAVALLSNSACKTSSLSPASTSSASSTTAASTGSSGQGGTPSVATCNGTTPPGSAYAIQPGPSLNASGGAGGTSTSSMGAGGMGAGGMGTGGGAMTAGAGGASLLDPTEVGAPLPGYRLTDMHPLSCGYQGVYGYELFEEKALVVVLLAAWCGFCQSQASYLEQMRLELEADGKGSDVQFVVINKADALDDLPYLVQRLSFPVLQDVDDVQAWNVHHRGIKDDFYIYGKDRKLHAFLREGEEVTVNLATDEGYATVKKAVLAAIGSD